MKRRRISEVRIEPVRPRSDARAIVAPEARRALARLAWERKSREARGIRDWRIGN